MEQLLKWRIIFSALVPEPEAKITIRCITSFGFDPDKRKKKSLKEKTIPEESDRLCYSNFYTFSL